MSSPVRAARADGFVLPGWALPLTIGTGVILPLAGTLILNVWLRGWSLPSLPLHSAIEVGGAVLGLILAAFLLWFPRSVFSSRRLWAVCALICMAVLDICHSCVPLGVAFVWLHSLSVFAGGVFFALVWLPERMMSRNAAWFVVVTLSWTCALVGLLSILNPQLLPAMKIDGEFTLAADILNFAGGSLTLLAAIHFAIRVHRARRVEDLILLSLCLLFGMAGVLFHLSFLWHAAWWFWHLLRFGGYLFAFSLALLSFWRTGVERDQAVTLREALVDSLEDGIFIIDPRKMRFIEVNQGACDSLGMSEKELLQIGPQDIKPLNTEEELRHLFEEVITSTGTKHFQTIHERKDGTRFPVDIILKAYQDMGRIYIVAAVRDNTMQSERDDAIDAQLSASRKAQQYLDIAGVMIFALDQNGCVTLINQKGCEILGYREDEVIGKNWFEHFVPEHTRDEVRPVAADLLAGRVELAATNENAILTKTGEERVIAWNNTVIRDANGEIIAHLSSGEDVTEKRLQEQELLKAKEVAESANNAKNTFLATMSHELRTPLNPIMGFTELLMDSDNLTEEQLEWLRLIFKRSDDLLKLIEDILNITRIEAGKLKIEKKAAVFSYLLNDVIEHVDARVQEKGLRLVSNIDPQLQQPIRIDPARIRQVLLNLVGNAVKFTESGEILISAKLLSSEFSNTSMASKSCIKISVKDTGIGIPKEKHEIVFHEFSQVDPEDTRNHDGAGLGLSICKRLVELMDGQISIDEAYTDGALFHILIPVDIAESTAKTRTDEKPFNESNLKRRRALLVEDDETNAMFFTMLLKHLNFDVLMAANGQEAVELCQKSAFAVIFMDVKMPIMNGIEATKIIRKQGNTTPIIGQTAYAFDTDKQACLDAGMNDWIPKPIKKAVLLDKLSQLSLYNT